MISNKRASELNEAWLLIFPRKPHSTERIQSLLWDTYQNVSGKKRHRLWDPLKQSLCDYFSLPSFCWPKELIPACVRFRIILLNVVYCMRLYHWRWRYAHFLLIFLVVSLLSNKILKISLLILFVFKFSYPC